MIVNHYRCAICNKVNNKSIETDIGDYIGHTHGSSFVKDYKFDDAFICHECNDVIQDSLYEYYINDEDLEND